MCPVGSPLSYVDPSTPPVAQGVLSLHHDTFLCFQLGVAIDPIHSRLAVASNFQGRPLPSLQYIKNQWWQAPGFSLMAWVLWVRLFSPQLVSIRASYE